MQNSAAPNMHVERLLSAYLDREVGGQERAQVEAHIQDCAECRALLEQMQALDTRLRRLRDRGGGVQIAPSIMRELGVERGEGGRVSTTEGRAQHHSAPHSRPLALAIRAAMSIGVVALIGILALFVMARIRELPQAPPPDASINTVVFNGSEMEFRLNAASVQGIRDISLTFWYDPKQKITQSFHYEYPQAEIEMSYRSLNPSSADPPWLGRALFYQWTIIEKSGRSTPLPLHYDVYSGNMAAQAWHAITTTNTIIFFTNGSQEKARTLYEPLVEEVYRQVTQDTGLTPDQPPLIYVAENGQSTTNWGLGTTSPIRLGLKASISARANQAELANSLTSLLLLEANLQRRNSITSRIINTGLPGYMGQRYLTSAESLNDRVMLEDAERSGIFYPLAEMDDVHPIYFDSTQRRMVGFIRYLMETKDKRSMARLLQSLDTRWNEDAWRSIYGQSLLVLYREWWDQAVATQTAAQTQPPALDLTKQRAEQIWSDPTGESLYTEILRAPNWSPDSSKIFYMRTISNSYYSFISDGKGEKRLNIPLSNVGFSPDGKTVLHLSYIQTQGGSRNLPMLVARNVDTNEVRVLAGGYTVMNLAWLPNDTIVFSGMQSSSGKQTLYMIDAASIKQVLAPTSTLTETTPAPLVPDGAIPGDAQLLAVSRDGTKLAVLGQAEMDTKLYLVSMGDTPTVKEILDLHDTVIDSVSFSPDGTQLAYTLQHNPNSTGIYVRNLDSGTEIRIGEANQENNYDLWPTWLGDHWLIFSSTRDGGYALFAARVNNAPQPNTPSTKILRLTSGSTYALRPVASPDGSRLVFFTLANQNLSMQLVPLDSTTLDKLSGE